MSVNFGEYLQAGLKKVFCGLIKEPSSNTDQLYSSGLALKNGDNRRNMREAFKKFTEAAESGHTLARGELAECYLHGRGCERDLIKAAELGSSKAALDLGKKMKRKGNERKCVRYLWMASDLGEEEATSQLSEIYRSGKMVEKDDDEADRLWVEQDARFQKFENGLEWGIEQDTKALFIRGNGRMGSSVPWEGDKQEIRFAKILDGVGSINREAFSGCSKLEKIEIPSTVTSIGYGPFANCDKLCCVDVSERNPKYASEGGRLRYRNGDTFIYSDSEAIFGNTKPIKCVLLGDQCVGKTSIIYYLMGREMAQKTHIGVDFHSYYATFQDKCVRFLLWDINPHEIFGPLFFRTVEGTNLFIIVIDLTRRTTFLELTRLIERVANIHCDKIILGNKTDSEYRQISTEEAEQFAKKNNLKYMEISVATGQNVEKVFKDYTEKVLAEKRH